MSNPDRVLLGASVSAIPTERGIEIRRELSIGTEEIVCVVGWAELDQLRALRPAPFLHLIARGAEP